MSTTLTRRTGRTLALAVVATLWFAAAARAWVLEISPGPRALYLQVGKGTKNGYNATVNVVSGTIPPAHVGRGIAVPLSTDSTQSTSFHDGYVVCSPPREVYVGGFFRMPTSGSGQTAQLRVISPTALSSGAHSIPISRVSWTSSAAGDATPHIPSGTFSGGSQVLRAVAANTWVENCLSFSYANTDVVPAGVYSAQVVYQLSSP